MRKQYHFRQSAKGLMAWDINRLIEISENLPIQEIPLSSIAELDETYWFDLEGDKPTCKKIIEHAKMISEVDLKYPIILSSNGRIMDGMHRVCKAFAEGRETIKAVRFQTDPEPDYIGIAPDKLPY